MINEEVSCMKKEETLTLSASIRSLLNSHSRRHRGGDGDDNC
jgi:hypothetical protein